MAANQVLYECAEISHGSPRLLHFKSVCTCSCVCVVCVCVLVLVCACMQETLYLTALVQPGHFPSASPSPCLVLLYPPLRSLPQNQPELPSASYFPLLNTPSLSQISHSGASVQASGPVSSLFLISEAQKGQLQELAGGGPSGVLVTRCPVPSAGQVGGSGSIRELGGVGVEENG